MKTNTKLGPMQGTLNLKLKVVTLRAALYCSFGINVINFSRHELDGIQVICQRKQTKLDDQIRTQVIRYEEIKAIQALDVKYYLLTR